MPAQNALDPVSATGSIAYIPVGAFEQHGPHLPLETDNLIAEEIISVLNFIQPGLTLPTVGVACSYEHDFRRGTVSVGALTATAYVNDLIHGLQQQGFDFIVIVNGHTGNYFLQNVAQQANSDTNKVILFPTPRAYADAFKDAELITGPHADIHAGEYETSIGLFCGFCREDLVPEETILSDDREMLHVRGMEEYTNTGYIGSPQLGTGEKGRRILQSYAQSYKRIIAPFL